MRLRREFSKLGALVRRRRPADDLEAEIRTHIEMEERENLESGMPPDEAHYAALRRFGNVPLAQERSREMWGWSWVETLWQDLRFGVRTLAKNRGFTAVAVLTLALGIGANTAIFSVVNAVLLKSAPFPFHDPERLVWLASGDLQDGFGDNVSLADFLEWKSRNNAFDRMAIFEGAWFTLAGDEPRRIHGDFISSDWLPTLGVQPMMGRNFEQSEEHAGRDGEVILSGDCWQRCFNADPNILGKTLTLNERSYTVVGILPAAFKFEDREIFAPLVPGAAVADHSEGSMVFHAFARLRRDVSLQQAKSEMTGIARRLEMEFQATNKGRLLRLVTLKEAATELQPTPRRMHETLWIMFGAVALVMLVACANVAGLLLARGVSRRREFAVRSALGSTRSRAIRQLFTETALLFAAGGAAGVALAFWSRDLLVKTMASYLDNAAVSTDARVFIFGLAVALAAGLVFGLAPARQAANVNLNDALKDSPQTTLGLSRTRIHSSLVVGEMALALVLLISFGLLFRSFLHVQAAPLGFDPANIVTISAGLDQPRYAASASRIALADNVLEKALALPAVEAAGVTDSLPLEGADGMRFVIEGQAASQGQEAKLRTVAVTPGLFRTLKILLLEGRAFSESDTPASPPVVVINQTMARRFFPGESPLGKRLRMEDSPNAWREIVGVVADVRQRNLDEDSAPIAYRPWNQAPQSSLSLAVRVASKSDMAGVAAKLRRELHSVDKSQVWAQPESMDQLIYESESVSLRRPIVRLLGVFGILAAMVAAVGLYGVMSYSVKQQTREIGIRVALGANRHAVLGLVFTRTARLAGLGIGLGIAASLALTRLLPTGPIVWTGAAIHLYGVSRTDLFTYAGFSALLALVAMVASYVPARRATKVDPMVALRNE
jgi:putative ABC transport system permease protein